MGGVGGEVPQEKIFEILTKKYKNSQKILDFEGGYPKRFFQNLDFEGGILKGGYP